jgi:putative transposase
MQHQAVKVRLYPTTQQQAILVQHFGCSRWWWNYALNMCIETYKATGKGLTKIALNKLLPNLKKTRGNTMVVGVLLSSFAINYAQLGNCLQKLF